MFKIIIFSFLLQSLRLQFLLAQTTKSSSLCPRGTGWYTNNGCQTAYYCERTIYNDPRIYYCRGVSIIFDLVSNTCKPASQVTCKPPTETCANGSGFYTLSGCKYYYKCKQEILNYSCPTGTLFDLSSARALGGNIFIPSIMCKKSNLVKC